MESSAFEAVVSDLPLFWSHAWGGRHYPVRIPGKSRRAQRTFPAGMGEGGDGL